MTRFLAVLIAAAALALGAVIGPTALSPAKAAPATAIALAPIKECAYNLGVLFRGYREVSNVTSRVFPSSVVDDWPAGLLPRY